MSLDGNKAVVRRFWEEGCDQRNVEVFDELMAPNCPYHVNSGVMIGAEPHKRAIEAFARAFPDGHFTVEELLAVDDKVISMVRFRGTHQGEFMRGGMAAPIPATGRQLDVVVIDIIRVADARFVEAWETYDTSWVADLARAAQQ
ncbi:MAG: ester cyclase [Candidatus Latescibacterota bacterium]